MAKKEIDISIGIDALIENGFFYLEEHQWKRAKEYFEKAIEISPRNPYPYIGKLLVTHKLPNMDSLPECSIDFRNTNNYKTALRYADESLKLKLKSYVEEYERKFEEKYQKMCSEFSIANSLEDYNRCYKAFVDFGDYKDSLELAQKAKEFIAQHNYEIYVKKIDNNLSEDECLQLYYDLLSMDYKESKKYAALYREKYEKIKRENENESIYLSAISRMNYAKSVADYIEIKKIFESISGYKDSNQWIQKCEDKIKRNRIPLFFHNLWHNNSALLLISLVVGIVFAIIFSNSLWTYILSLGTSLGFALFYYYKLSGKYIGRAVSIALIVAILFTSFVVVLPKGGSEEFDPDKCYWCDGYGYYITEEGGRPYTCSHCNGTGHR